MGRPENVEIERKGDYILMMTPAGRYSIYKDIGHRWENIYAKLKPEGTKPDGRPLIKEWEAVDVVMQIKDRGASQVSLDDVLKEQEQVQYIQTSGGGAIEREMIDRAMTVKRPSTVSSRVYTEETPSYPETNGYEYPPSELPPQRPQEQDWAVVQRTVSPMQRSRFREVAGRSPTQERWGRY